MIVSWDPAAHPGTNVVIHEFAHTLDMANGEADGFPPLRAGMSRAAWAQAFNAAYTDLCHRVDHDPPTSPRHGSQDKKRRRRSTQPRRRLPTPS